MDIPNHESTKPYDKVEVNADYRPIQALDPHKSANWKPFVLRLPSLTLFLAFTLCLLAVLEYTLRTLPHLDSAFHLEVNTSPSYLEAHHRKRAAQVLVEPSFTNDLGDLFPFETPVPTVSTTSSEETGPAAPSVFAEEITSLSVSTRFTSSLQDPTTVDRTRFADQRFIVTTTASTMNSPVLSPTSSSFLQSTFIGSAGSPAPAAYAGEETFFSVTFSPISYDDASKSDSSLTESRTSLSTSSNIVYTFISGAYVGPTTTYQPISPIRSSPHIESYSPFNDPGQVTSIIAPSSSETATRTQAMTVTALFNWQNPYYNEDLLPKNTTGTSFLVVVVYPLWAFIVPTTVPVGIFVIYKIIWSSMHTWIGILEPFKALTSNEGAIASHGFLSYYLSSQVLPDFVSGLFKGHWIIFSSSLTSFMMSFLPSLASEVVKTSTMSCPLDKHSTNQHNPCSPALMVNVTVARVMQTLLALGALVLFIFAIIFRKNTRTGVHADPTSIVSIASLTHHPGLLQDFGALCLDDNLPDMARKIGKRKYALGPYQTTDGSYRYGFYPKQVAERGLADHSPSAYEHSQAIHAPGTVCRENSKKQNSWIIDATSMTIALGTLAVIIAYYIDGSDSGFNHFFNSDGFGPRFILTAAGSIIAMQWRRFHGEMSIKATYRTLSKGHSVARTSILMTKSSTELTTIMPSILRKHYLLAVVAFIAVLSEVLVVALAGVPFGSGELWMQYIVSAYISFTILGMMLIVSIVIIFWKVYKAPHLPRGADTIGAAISYLVSSRLLEVCNGLEFSSEEKRFARIDMLGARWKYGLVLGADGCRRWAVDEDHEDAGL